MTGLRITHALFGFAVLASLYALLARGGAKPWQAALACGALALDPGFTYAFRTQSYITLAPAALLFLSLYSLQRAADSAVRNRWLFLRRLVPTASPSSGTSSTRSSCRRW